MIHNSLFLFFFFFFFGALFSVRASSHMALLNSNAAFGEKIQNEITSQKNIGDNVITTLNVTPEAPVWDYRSC